MTAGKPDVWRFMPPLINKKGETVMGALRIPMPDRVVYAEKIILDDISARVGICVIGLHHIDGEKFAELFKLAEQQGTNVFQPTNL